MLGAPIVVAAIGIPVCLATEYEQFRTKLKHNDSPFIYANAAIIQSLVLFLIYCLVTWN